MWKIFGSKNLKPLSDDLFDQLNFKSNQFYLYLQDKWQIFIQYGSKYRNTNRIQSLRRWFTFFSTTTFSIQWNSSHLGQFDVGISFMQQAQHIITATDNGLPNELWVPATKMYQPQTSVLMELSYAKMLKQKWNYDISFYYRKMQNTVRF